LQLLQINKTENKTETKATLKVAILPSENIHWRMETSLCSA
jgi:hypothetical protein